MYCTSRGVSSILVNEEQARRLGKPWKYACPISVYFERGEVISSMHALSLGCRDTFMVQGPYILVS